MRQRLSAVYNSMHWFSDADAWKIFRLAAFAEAATWIALIVSIIIRNNGLPGGDIAVSMAGTVHGAMLAVYITLICVLARSMEWGWVRVVSGLIVGNIPLATIPFERTVAWYRKAHPVQVAAPAGYDED